MVFSSKRSQKTLFSPKKNGSKTRRFFLDLWWLNYGYLKQSKKPELSNARWMNFIVDILVILDNKTKGRNFWKWHSKAWFLEKNFRSDPINFSCLSHDIGRWWSFSCVKKQLPCIIIDFLKYYIFDLTLFSENRVILGQKKWAILGSVLKLLIFHSLRQNIIDVALEIEKKI